ncbi:PREDICTED: uncharacterized protein LOC109175663 [Ipomoea nil]|uniref:uncharacterized protein LOC109175663 n=1 Tax=Ipomoea nil TaxID=35883 RepID=UPI00090157FD|nr:PREDICTED: uncharacterized protein LOC109175663 [Ipomoea nil]
MSEKGGSFRANPRVHWWFKLVVLGACLVILILWGIHSVNLSVINAPKDFVILKFNGSSKEFRPEFKDFGYSNLQLPPQDEPSGSRIGNWVLAELEDNYSSKLLEGWLTPGGEPCKDSRSVGIRVPGLDDREGLELSTGDIHEFVFQAVDEKGQAHCLGGDYFEIDLSGEKWKSRPPTKDLGNGTYRFHLQVHPDFHGDYNVTIILLFQHYEGMRFSPQRFAFDRVLRVFPVKFTKSRAELPEISQCVRSDLARNVWSGRWTRHAKNDTCLVDNGGRFICQDPSFPCQKPWCHGAMGGLESNGWVYSAHCSFKMFSSEEAWNCLNKKWIFWWGDSNHCDTIRNILHFILDFHDIPDVPRRFDANITNPKDPSQTVRLTSIFNGHPNETGNYHGLYSLANAEYREFLKGYFSGNVVPDTIIMNSGLHDGVYWPSIRAFIKGADYTAAFWSEVIQAVKQRHKVPPKLLYRTTVTTGGYARTLAYNPQKMEAFNGVVLDKLRAYAALDMVIDDFDMTYPWHYDNRCNDGVHYGRAPAKLVWRDGQIGHQYFVDLMLGHVLLNALCSRW